MTISSTTTTTVLQTSGVSPATADEVFLPLSRFDLLWIHFHPIRRLLFYKFPCSKSHFLQTLIPRLHHSLSAALTHYPLVAGRILYPINATDENDHKKPIFRYSSQDSLQFTVAESSHNFDELVSNHPRDADQFYDFVPPLPPIEEEGDYKLVPLFAIKVTLFPDVGLCIGFANHHALGDASSIFRFISAWAEINSNEDDDDYVGKHGKASLPIFRRSVIEDPLGIDDIFWKVFKKIPLQASSFPLPTGRVRSTYTFDQSTIKKLKNHVLTKKPQLEYVSSFVVVGSYIWTCMVRSGDAIGEKVDENVLEHFTFSVDIRGGRVDPPVPVNYFGNCLSFGLGKLEHRVVVDEENGFADAAESISEDIRTRVNKKNEVVKGMETWMSEMEKYVGIRALGVSGSPKFDLCGTDFGWGRARKLEVASIDGEKYSMSICRSGSDEGALEVGLSLPKDRMMAFAALFADGLDGLVDNKF